MISTLKEWFSISVVDCEIHLTLNTMTHLKEISRNRKRNNMEVDEQYNSQTHWSSTTQKWILMSLGDDGIGRWWHLGDDDIWAMILFGRWWHLGDDVIWAIKPFGRWCNLGNDDTGAMMTFGRWHLGDDGSWAMMTFGRWWHLGDDDI